jgi:hypothetical protein
VYPLGSAALRHVATSRLDDVDTRILARERARFALFAMDSRNHCEMGISSMSENSCTTSVDPLDSVYGDASEASHDIATCDFRREKILCANRPTSEFGTCRVRALRQKASESVPPIR